MPKPLRAHQANVWKAGRERCHGRVRGATVASVMHEQHLGGLVGEGARQSQLRKWATYPSVNLSLDFGLHDSGEFEPPREHLEKHVRLGGGRQEHHPVNLQTLGERKPRRRGSQ